MKSVVYETGNDKEFIRQLIDEAMEKKDRTVSIYISNTGTSISISPLGADKPRWIRKSHAEHVCSECGWHTSFQSPYCPVCGEKLANTEEEQNE